MHHAFKKVKLQAKDFFKIFTNVILTDPAEMARHRYFVLGVVSCEMHNNHSQKMLYHSALSYSYSSHMSECSDISPSQVHRAIASHTYLHVLVGAHGDHGQHEVRVVHDEREGGVDGRVDRHRQQRHEEHLLRPGHRRQCERYRGRGGRRHRRSLG